jgi:hypothetical protein
MIDMLAEATYIYFRSMSTREEMGELIHVLLLKRDASPEVRDVAIRMAMIYRAEEG